MARPMQIGPAIDWMQEWTRKLDGKSEEAPLPEPESSEPVVEN